MKIRPIVTNCTKNYRSPIYKSLLENAGDATMHNSLNPLPYFPHMHSPALIVSETYNGGVPLETETDYQIIIKKYPRELYQVTLVFI